jgi:hypothetical protein
MTTTDVEQKYNEFLKTPEGNKLVMVGREMMRQTADWKRKVFMGECGNFWMKWVREAYLPDAWKGKAVKVKCGSFGVNNCCNQNAKWLEEEFGWKKVWGFNISACRCGGRMSLEPHSLNRHPDGSLVDITRDFMDETEKWFFPVENAEFAFREYNERYGGAMIAFQPACSCEKKMKWDNRGRVFFDDEDDFVGWVEEMRQYPHLVIRKVRLD